MYITADAVWGNLSGGKLAGNTDGRLFVHCKRLQANNGEDTSPRVPGVSFMLNSDAHLNNFNMIRYNKGDNQRQRLILTLSLKHER